MTERVYVQGPTIDEAKLAQVMAMPLKAGAHTPDEDEEFQACVMEAVAYVAGESWTDGPQCVSPVISSLLRSLNDRMRSDEEREMLKPLIPIIIGTRSTGAADLKRRYMISDWLVRVNAPRWLDFGGDKDQLAGVLRGLAPIVDRESALAARDILRPHTLKVADRSVRVALPKIVEAIPSLAHFAPQLRALAPVVDRATAIAAREITWQVRRRSWGIAAIDAIAAIAAIAASAAIAAIDAIAAIAAIAASAAIAAIDAIDAIAALAAIDALDAIAAIDAIDAIDAIAAIDASAAIDAIAASAAIAAIDASAASAASAAIAAIDAIDASVPPETRERIEATRMESINSLIDLVKELAAVKE